MSNLNFDQDLFKLCKEIEEMQTPIAFTEKKYFILQLNKKYLIKVCPNSFGIVTYLAN